MFDVKLITNPEPFRLDVRLADGSDVNILIPAHGAAIDKEGYIWGMVIDGEGYDLYYKNQSTARMCKIFSEIILPTGLKTATSIALKKLTETNPAPKWSTSQHPLEERAMSQLNQPIILRAQGLFNKLVMHNAESYYGDVFGRPVIVHPAPKKLVLTAQERGMFGMFDF